MKKFISKNWEKIMILIGVVILIMILINKITFEKTLIADYVKYGKDIAPSNPDMTTTEASSGGLLNFAIFRENPELTKFAMIFGAGILFVVFITTLTTALSAKKDAKKKK